MGHLRFIKVLIMVVVPTFAFAQSNGEVVDGVVAVVGKHVILKSDVDEQYAVFKRQNFSQSLSHCDVLEELLFQKLLIHHAEIDSVVVGEEEVEANMDRRIDQLVYQMGDKDKLEEFYGKSIVEIKEEMRQLIKDQMVAQRMQMSITEGLEITPSEVRLYFERLPEDSIPLIPMEVELSQIVKYPEVSKEAEEEVIAKLKNIKERIENGSRFSSMAILYSEDPGSNKKGGEYKGIQRGVFVKEFEAVAFNLRIGEISDPFKTEFGYHIVQVLDKRGEELDLRHILIKPKLTQLDMQEAKNFLDSIAATIARGEMTFEEAAKRYSEDESTRFNGGQMANLQTGDMKFEMNALDRSLYALVNGLEQGEISAPTYFTTPDQKEAFRLVRLENKYEPHKANIEQDFQRIKGYALQEKQLQKIDEWRIEKLLETYVRVNSGYYPCEQVAEEWNANNSSES